MSQNSIEIICGGHANLPDALLEILHEAQREFGFLSKETLVHIARILNISRADIHGVVSFYDDFRLTKSSGSTIKICRAEACQAVGGEALAKYTQDKHIKTHDVYCLGNCALGPAIMIDEHLYGRVDTQRLEALLTEHEK